MCELGGNELELIGLICAYRRQPWQGRGICCDEFRGRIREAEQEEIWHRVAKQMLVTNILYPMPCKSLILFSTTYKNYTCHYKLLRVCMK